MSTRASSLGLLTLVVLFASGMALGQDAEWKTLNAQITELSRTGQYDRAIVVGKKALAVAEQGGNQLFVATSLNSLAVLYHAQRQYAQAEPLYQRVLAIVEKAFGPDDLNVAGALENYARMLKADQRDAEAEPLLQRAKAIRGKAAARRPTTTAVKP